MFQFQIEVPAAGSARAALIGSQYAEDANVMALSEQLERLSHDQIRDLIAKPRPIEELPRVVAALATSHAPRDEAVERGTIAVQAPGLTALRDINAISRLFYVRTLDDEYKRWPLSVTQIMSLGTILAQKIPHEAQRDCDWPSPQQVRDDMDEIAAIPDVTNAMVFASLEPPTSTKEIIFPQVALWQYLARSSQFTTTPGSGQFVYLDQVYKLDAYDGVADEDFDKLVDLLGSHLKGTVHGVKLDTNDRYAIGYLSTVFSFKLEASKVIVVQNSKHAYSGPIDRNPEAVRRALRTGLPQWALAMSESALVRGGEDWYHFVACCYSYAKLKGILGFEWTTRAYVVSELVFDATRKRIIQMLGHLDDLAGLNAVLKGDREYGNTQIWCAQSAVYENVRDRRDRWSKSAQTLTHHLDAGPNSYGFRSLDMVAVISKAKALVLCEYRRVVVLTGNTIKGIPTSHIKALFPGKQVDFI